MNFLIGGFSEQQYKAYLNPSLAPKPSRRANHWVAHFHLARYPTLAIFINRLAYFLLHRFSAYPNNRYLFDKFKSHQFDKVTNPKEYATIQRIFKCFELCQEIDQEALKKIRENLTKIETKLQPLDQEEQAQLQAGQEQVEQEEQAQLQAEQERKIDEKEILDPEIDDRSPPDKGQMTLSEEDQVGQERKIDEEVILDPEIDDRSPPDEGQMTLSESEREDLANLGESSHDEALSSGAEDEEPQNDSKDFSYENKTEQASAIALPNFEQLKLGVEGLDLLKKIAGYKQAKEEHASSWNFMRPPFDRSVYQDATQDCEYLGTALEIAENLIGYFSTYKQLYFEGNFKEADKAVFQAITQQICILGEAVKTLEDIYRHAAADNQAHQLMLERARQITCLCVAYHSEVRSIGAWLSDAESGETSPISSESESENPTNRIQDNNQIGKDVELLQNNKGLWGAFYNYTVGLVLNETTEKKYLRWKIERYEDLIKGAQQSIVVYLEQQNLQEYLQKPLKVSDHTPKWVRQLFPILELCSKSFRNDEERLHPDYLAEVRAIHQQTLLENLRQAADWAESHPHMPGTEHVNAICYQLYATLDLNQRCLSVFKTFIDLGRISVKERVELKYKRLRRPLHKLTQGLKISHQLIQLAPNDAKAPLVKQWLNSLRGHVNGVRGVTSFDPNMQSNPLHVLFNKEIRKKGAGVNADTILVVKDIAMGSPTIEIGNGQAKINPEFKGFLRHCKAHSLRHLYINNQNFIPKDWTKGDESARCQALHDLAEHEFKDTLFVITLSQNSSFYEQKGHALKSLNIQTTKDQIFDQLLHSAAFKGYLHPDLCCDQEFQNWMKAEMGRLHVQEFANRLAFKDKRERSRFVHRFHSQLRQRIERVIQAFDPNKKLGYSIYDPSATKFKQEFIAQVFDRPRNETGNYISEDLVERFALRDWSIMLADQIHQKLFAGSERLRIKERRVFIRVFYQNLARKILIETQANSYNASCKDRIDRGAATDAEDFAYLAILANCASEPHVIEFFKMLVFARAIIVRKRTIIEERLERLIETVEFMLKHQQALQELQEELFPGIDITIDQFKTSVQTASNLENI